MSMVLMVLNHKLIQFISLYSTPVNYFILQKRDFSPTLSPCDGDKNILLFLICFLEIYQLQCAHKLKYTWKEGKIFE